jgi:hypothetical protein
MDKQSSKSPTPGGSRLSEEINMQVNTATVNNTHAVVIAVNGVEYLYASNSSAHVCSAIEATARRDIARHGDVDVYIAGLPVVQKRINRHGRVVRFTA